MVSSDGRPVNCLNNVQITPHRSLDEAGDSDLIVVPSITNIEGTLDHSTKTIEWLGRQHRRGTTTKYCGRNVALECSKALLHDMNRTSQAPYSAFRFQKNHTDETVEASQRWIEKNYAREINLDRVAKIHGMSRRTFERRFKKATGDTPLYYLQRTRVEAAKRLLENGGGTFDEICYRLGYENSGHFREVFKKHTGLLPTEYQRHFCIP